MQTFEQGVHGFRVLMSLYADRFLFAAGLLAALWVAQFIPFVMLWLGL